MLFTKTECENIVKFIKENYEIVSDEWSLVNLPFGEDFFSNNTLEEMGIKQVLKENGHDLSEEEIRDEENEIGLHLYWDKVNHPDTIKMGLYAFGGGDIELDFTPKDMLPQSVYDELLTFGYDKLDNIGEKGADFEV